MVALIGLTTFYAIPSLQTLTVAATYDDIVGLLASDPGSAQTLSCPCAQPSITFRSYANMVIETDAYCPKAVNPDSTSFGTWRDVYNKVLHQPHL